jgi:hypothetical protein
MNDKSLYSSHDPAGSLHRGVFVKNNTDDVEPSKMASLPRIHQAADQQSSERLSKTNGHRSKASYAETKRRLPSGSSPGMGSFFEAQSNLRRSEAKQTEDRLMGTRSINKKLESLRVTSPPSQVFKRPQPSLQGYLAPSKQPVPFPDHSEQVAQQDFRQQYAR